LLGKRHGITGNVKSLRGQDTARLMVAMIFTDERAGQEGEDHLRAREPDDAYELLERGTVPPVGKRLQNILRGCVMSVQEPYVRDAQRIEGPSRFDFANLAKRRSLLRPGLVRAAASARAIDHSDAFVFIGRPRQIRSDRAFIVRVRNNQQDVCLVALIRLGKNLRLLRDQAKREQACQQDKSVSCESFHEPPSGNAPFSHRDRRVYPALNGR